MWILLQIVGTVARDSFGLKTFKGWLPGSGTPPDWVAEYLAEFVFFLFLGVNVDTVTNHRNSGKR